MVCLRSCHARSRSECMLKKRWTTGKWDAPQPGTINTWPDSSVFRSAPIQQELRRIIWTKSANDKCTCGNAHNLYGTHENSDKLGYKRCVLDAQTTFCFAADCEPPPAADSSGPNTLAGFLRWGGSAPPMTSIYSRFFVGSFRLARPRVTERWSDHEWERHEIYRR
jgi:hypothetical protein